MADQPINPLEEKTRSNVTYIYVIGAIILLGYILYRWGDKMEILTLIIGLIGGSLLNGPNSVYFGGNTGKKTDQPTVNQTGDNTTTIVQPPKDTTTI